MIYRSLKKGSVQLTPLKATSGHLETLKPGETLEMRSSQMTHAQKMFLQTRKLLVACDWLCKFVCETRKRDGEEYTPRSLYLLLNGLQRYIRKTEEFNIWKDPVFTPALKPGRVIRVTFSPGHPGLTQIGSREKRNCSFDDVELINVIA